MSDRPTTLEEAQQYLLEVVRDDQLTADEAQLLIDLGRGALRSLRDAIDSAVCLRDDSCEPAVAGMLEHRQRPWPEAHRHAPTSTPSTASSWIRDRFDDQDQGRAAT